MLAFIFVAGWGNVRKKHVETLGRFECPNCRQLTQWDVYNIEKRATVFFVPVVKYASQQVIICSGCGAGTEVTSGEIRQLREALAHPPGPPAAPVAPARATAGSSPAEERPSRDIDGWFDAVSSQLADAGFTETERQGRDASIPGVQIVGAAMYSIKACECTLFLCPDAPCAQRLAAYWSTQLAQLVEKGCCRVASVDSRAFLVYDKKYRDVGGTYNRFVSAAARVRPPA